GSLIIGNPPHVLKEMRQQVPATIKGPTEEYEYYMELMALLNNLLETARSRGFKFLDSHIEAPEQSSIFLMYPLVSEDHRLISFITDNLRL
ncbi:flagellar motor stator protein MotA, partial [Escherichia coli]|nr:flagellar motor stator protein MotA [Escherichia coli]